jgi:FkbM family methyltransferase
VISTLRRIGASPPVRRVLTSRQIEPLVAAVLRASPVRERARFLLAELGRRGHVRAYRLRGSGAVVHVRHRTPDVAALGEVFYERQYEPPPGVAAFLEGLGRPPAILDLGANVGYFTVFASLRFPGSRLVAFEPDPANAELMRQTLAANGLSCELVEAAATTKDGQVPFSSGGFTLSRIEAGGEPVRAVDVLPRLPEFDLAKIDIEGGEWELLADPRFGEAAPAALALEHHTHLAPVDADAEEILERAGYSIERRLPFDEGHGLLWAFRRQ